MISHRTITLLAGAVLTANFPRVSAGTDYVLSQLYNQYNFFKEFDFFSEHDPSNGYVKYVNASTANQDKLAGYQNGGIYLGVDHTNKVTNEGGRVSVRVTSKANFTRGLFVGDIAHMPSGKTDNDSCGLWPAYWTVGPNWPNDGEIDILEGINTMSSAAITVHTGDSFNVTNTGSLDTTQLQTKDCQWKVGCRQELAMKATYGADFNAAGGGIYVVEWTDDVINAWFFGRKSKMPSSLTNAIAASSSSDYSSSSSSSTASPRIDVGTLGTPVARFNPEDGRSFDMFKSHNIVINTDFCGDWVNSDWPKNPVCSKKGSCEDYVANNPQAFEDAYWVINSIGVYTISGDAVNQTTADTGSSGTSSKAKRGDNWNGFGNIKKGRRSFPFYS